MKRETEVGGEGRLKWRLEGREERGKEKQKAARLLLLLPVLCTV